MAFPGRPWERGDRLMLSYRNLFLGALATAAAGFLVILPRHGAHAGADAAPTAAAAGKALGMFGVSPARNMVNLVEKNPPTDWEAPKTAADKGTNTKWVAKLGSVA